MVATVVVEFVLGILSPIKVQQQQQVWDIAHIARGTGRFGVTLSFIPGTRSPHLEVKKKILLLGRTHLTVITSVNLSSLFLTRGHFVRRTNQLHPRSCEY